ncbi:MAG: hypothetical protein R3F14_01300 [Polyangiaceae bacterium]
MRSRPDLDIRLPSVVHPGDRVDVEIVAQSLSDTPIDFFDLTFSGDSISNFIHESIVEHRRGSILKVTTRLREEGILTEGEHRFSASFQLPPDAPPSYLGVYTAIRYEVRVHISIPWWPDLRETYEILVVPHSAVRPPPDAVTSSSFKTAGSPFIEVSLADTHYAAGDEIAGAFAAGNVPREAAEGVEIALVATEHLRISERTFRAEQVRHNHPNVFRVPSVGDETSFRFRVPKDAIPSFETEDVTLEWALLVTLRLHSGSPVTCTIPITVARHEARRPANARVPDVGAARWRAAWSAAGAPYGLVTSETGLALVGTRGPVRIEATVHESDDEVAMSATLRYPSLMLGLRAAPQTFVMLPSELELALSGFKVEQRELDQACAFLSGPLLFNLRRVRLLSIDDTSLTFRTTVAGFDAEGIAPFLDQLDAVITSLVEAIENIPVPSAMRDFRPAWQELARITGGRFTPGGMAIESASIDGALFFITTLFEEDATIAGTKVALEVDPPLRLRGPLDPGAPETWSEVPPGCHDFAKALLAHVTRLAITSRSISFFVPGLLPDPADLRPRMIELLVLSRRLRGERTPGPYR